MAKHSFQWYLHSDHIWESEHEFKRLNSNLPTEVAEYLMDVNPFYEIEVHCTYDDVTGEITYDRVT